MSRGMKMADKASVATVEQKSSLQKRKKKIHRLKALGAKRTNEPEQTNDVEPSAKKVRL